MTGTHRMLGWFFHRRGVMLAAAAMLVVPAATLLLSAPARALEVYSEGKGGRPFSLSALPATLNGGTSSDPSLSLALRPLAIIDGSSPVWRGSATLPNPRDVYPLDDGHILMVDKENKFVAELDGSGAVVWKYSNDDGAAFLRPFSAQPATFGGRRCVLIAERLQYRVFAVSWDAAKQVVWQYGTSGEYGLGVNHLMDPFAAVQLPDGNVLISDENGGNRVIEVKASDYDPTAPDMGYSARSIVWQYGSAGVAGVGVNQVQQPRWPQRLENGPGGADDTTLLTDSSGQQVIEVRDADYDPLAQGLGYTAGSVVWSYGVPAVKGRLNNPNRAARITSGPMKGLSVIADSDGHRILWISSDGLVERTLDTNALDPPASYLSNGSDPRSAVYGPDWSLWIADPGYHRILRVGYEPQAVAQWRPLDCGKPRQLKAFVRLTLQGSTVQGDTTLGAFALEYSTDGGSVWSAGRLKYGRFVDFPKGTAGKTIALRIALRSADRWHAPVLDGFTLHYTEASTGPTGGGGGGKKPGGTANTGPEDAVYTYPGVSGAGGSGSGTGAGTSGHGGGAGTSGAGTGGAPIISPVQSAGSPVPAPPASSAVGPDQNVTGVEVQGLEGISGFALKAAPGAHAADQPAEAGEPVPVAAIAVVSLGALASLLLPWPVFAARLREIGSFDHARMRRSPRQRLMR